jgi:hypothetical protein
MCICVHHIWHLFFSSFWLTPNNAFFASEDVRCTIVEKNGVCKKHSFFLFAGVLLQYHESLCFYWFTFVLWFLCPLVPTCCEHEKIDENADFFFLVSPPPWFSLSPTHCSCFLYPPYHTMPYHAIPCHIYLS